MNFAAGYIVNSTVVARAFLGVQIKSDFGKEEMGMRDLKDRIVMITGASSGFGEVTARAIVAEGGKVVLGARREDRLRDLVGELGKDNAVYSVTDVTKKQDLKDLARAGIDAFGRIDALVNNAGIMPLSLLAAGRTDEWDAMIDTNIKGVLYGIDAVLAHMMERGDGSIINISSVAGLRVMPVSSVYSATKFAVRAISEGLRQETAGKLQVTVICPGAFTTELIGSIKDEMILGMIESRGVSEISQPPERIADAILYALKQDPAVTVSEMVVQPTAPMG